MLLDEGSEELFPIPVEFLQVRRRLGNCPLEVISCPLDGVLDLVGEVLEGAEGDGFLRGVDDVVVAQGVVRDDDLGVAFGPQGATLKQRLFVPDALLIDVLPCLDVVDRIHHEVQLGPEIVIEELFAVGAHSHLH